MLFLVEHHSCNLKSICWETNHFLGQSSSLTDENSCFLAENKLEDPKDPIFFSAPQDISDAFKISPPRLAGGLVPAADAVACHLGERSKGRILWISRIQLMMMKLYQSKVLISWFIIRNICLCIFTYCYYQSLLLLLSLLLI